MIVRFGYVAMSVHLKNASPSQTMTVKQFEQIKDKEAAIRKLERIAVSNLENCYRLLKHNLAHDITFFRLSSKLVPLVNHPHTEGWKYEEAIAPILNEIGEFITKHQMRIGFHPDHFVVINNLDEDLLKRSIHTLIYHYKLLKGMNIDPMHRCVLHVGGAKNGVVEGLEEFIENFEKIPKAIQQMLILENDDTVYHIEDVLYLGEKLQIPVVLDIHHHDIHQPKTFSFLEVWDRVLETWKHSSLPVKIHVSSPKEDATDKRHHDYIDVERLMRFLTSIKGTVEQLDVMIEAKMKDEALIKLMKQLQTRHDCSVISGASIKLEGN
ncbi:UV DNA damage repair endonuclease UvsE [Anaerobacillus isosaccharinicus]|uniref:UV DNA damage repair endonuclease UvsE n=1 Tax=Anaerobacillus isosaccharinicus TaxID=1532552 RepID=A0A1S2M7D7_9BACI|nr:UV DNA damage repair endonuclease UvsE [Anaerobacillus isosaccharinicus]MBA5587465.1 UV DNA damage repair endonuclease UvsE [Anaerobacillus isosaccharinicus]QOY34351.1 UV DNA damage repair endonuclease UvsE [Anaerobacillus isosaccharinicus]